MSEHLSAEDRIAAYSAAYELANRAPPPTARYARGYYYLRYGTGLESAHRAREIEEFTERLRYRASQAAEAP